MEVIEKYFTDFDSRQLEQIEKLGRMYREWNEKVNLISRKDMDNFYNRHVLHSLSIAAIFNFYEGSQVLDLGTGGGFPGIPLAILYPEVEFTLVDSVAKKVKVVEDVSQKLGLDNVKAKWTRAEDMPRHQQDFVVSRAVAPLEKLWRWSKPLLRKGQASEEYRNGLITLKGGDLGQEISESGLRPRIFDVNDIFPKEGFEEKFVLYVPV